MAVKKISKKYFWNKNKQIDTRNPELDLTQGIFGKWSFVNRNYELLKSADNMAKAEKWTTLKLFLRQKLALFGLVVFLLTLIMALIMPAVLGDPKVVDADNKHASIFSDGHIFGTDFLGRDIWTRMWSGLRFSFGIAAMAVMVDLVVGFIMGALMGFFPKFDIIGQFIIKVFTNLPSIILLILLAIVLEPSFWTIVLGVTITGWIGMANQVRGYVIRTKSQDWVEAARTMGTSKSRILFKKMTPHLIPIIVAQLIFTIPSALIGDLSLSVLGLSIPNTASLGSLLESGRKFLLIYPSEIVIPVVVSTIVLSSIQFIGFGMQKAVSRGV